MKIFLIFPITICLYSCSNNQKKTSFNFKSANHSLTISTSRLKIQNDSLYKVLDQKLDDKETSQDAKNWEPKAIYLQYRTEEIYKYIQTHISNLTTDSILNNADSLYTKLNFYKGNLLRIDPDISIAISNDAASITQYFDSVRQNKSENFDLFFTTKSKEEQLLILNQTFNKIELVENKTLHFCNSKIN